MKTTNEEEDFSFAMQLTGAAALPMVMRVAIDLDVFEIIAKAGPGAQLSPKSIASHLPTQNPNAHNMIDRILRLLTSYSVLNSSLVTGDNGLVERLYGLEPVCKYFVRNEDGVAVAPFMLLVQDKVFIDSWFHLKDVVLAEFRPLEYFWRSLQIISIFPIVNMVSIQNQTKTTNEEEDFSFAMQLTGAAALPMVMRVAIDLDVFEIIAKAGPGAQLSPKSIAYQLPTQNPNAHNMIDRILRLLTSYSVLNSSLVTGDNGLVERLYGLEPVCKYFVRNEDGVSVSPFMLLVQDKVFIDSWFHLKDAVLEGGIPFNKAHGMHAFEYPGIDPKFNQVFNRAMFNHTTIVVKKILEVYRGFEDLKEVVDVGGGLGTTLSIITSKYPALRGINFDLPHVVEHAPSYPGIILVCNLNVLGPPYILFQWILHDWSDDECIKLLKNCYKALPEHGKLIVVDAILPVAPESDSAAKSLCQLDVSMMTQNPGGKERSEKEFETLAKGAGFASINKACCVYNYWVIEFCK
ncbi:hypothetical protein IFM89_030347 [Coptis chinensis]|uniref:Uncharacterized protein n=1 Tax=Coptis chinensis TaxID=261450 RepID=A0A835ICU5_9MAGN|nr:hypothetical protein IFM89_030347 [Coptis chinensis]